MENPNHQKGKSKTSWRGNYICITYKKKWKIQNIRLENSNHVVNETTLEGKIKNPKHRLIDLSQKNVLLKLN